MKTTVAEFYEDHRSALELPGISPERRAEIKKAFYVGFHLSLSWARGEVQILPTEELRVGCVKHVLTEVNQFYRETGAFAEKA